MATLTGTKIKDTYKSLIKVNDNAELSATLQELTDGNGNVTGISINTSGDLKATGTLEFGSLKDTGEAITITKFVDEADGIGNNDNDTTIPTSAAIKDYVDSKITLEDLDFQGDTGTGSVDLDSQSLDIAGGTGIDTVASGQSLTVNIDTTVATLTDTQTLTNKTINADNNTISNLEVDNLKAGVLDTDLNAVSALDNTVASAKAIKTYVDSQVTAQDLDFIGDTGTGAVDLDSQSLSVTGGTGIDTTASGQDVSIAIDSTVATLTGTQTLTNKTIDLTDNTISGTTAEFNTALSDNDFATLAGTETLTNKTIDADNNTVSNLEVDNLKAGVLDTDLTTVSATDDTLASAKAIKTYVDANITAQDLDITDGTVTSAVDLDSQTMTIQGTANEVEVGLIGQSFTVGLPDDVTIAGDLTVDTDTLFVNSVNNRVGLGTASPSDNLHISGTTASIRLQDSDGTDTFGRLRYTGSSVYFISRNNTSNGNFIFIGNNGTSDTEYMRIHSGGDISFRDTSNNQAFYWDASASSLGIGTTSINSKVQIEQAQQISGAFSNPFIKLSNSAQTDNTGQTSIALATSTADNYGYAISAQRGTSGSDSDFIITHHNNSLTGTERLRIDSSGNVGIGTTSPTNNSKLTVLHDTTGATGTTGGLVSIMDAKDMALGNGGGIRFGGIYQTGGTPNADMGYIKAYKENATSGNFSYALTFGTRASGGNPTERMRITSGGAILFGTTGDPDGTSNYGSAFTSETSQTMMLRLATSTSGAKNLATFYNPNGAVGKIQVNGTATSYITSSDYRLKENVVPMEGALDRVDALKPSRFNFIADADKTVDGFLAHEVADVVPEAISGEKDAVEEYEVTPAVLDDEGNVIEEAVMETRPVYQGIDQSKLVPLLVGAIQELKAEIETLKQQINP